MRWDKNIKVPTWSQTYGYSLFSGRVNITNPSTIVENAKVNLELAEGLTDEKHIDEFEAVVRE